MRPLRSDRLCNRAALLALFGATLLGGCSDPVYRQQVGIDVWGNTVPMPVWTRKGGVASDKDCLALQTAPGEAPKCGSLSYTDSDGGAIVSDILKGLGVAVNAADAAAIWREANAISQQARAEEQTTSTASSPVTVNTTVTATNALSNSNQLTSLTKNQLSVLNNNYNNNYNKISVPPQPQPEPKPKQPNWQSPPQQMEPGNNGNTGWGMDTSFNLPAPSLRSLNPSLLTGGDLG